MAGQLQKSQPEARCRQLEDLAQIIAIGLGDKPPTLDQTEKVRAWLAANPDEFRHWGELSSHATQTVVETATTWAVERESVYLRLAELKANLGYEQSNYVERLLIDQVALCWAQLYFLEKTLAHATSGRHNPDSGLYWDRRVTAAQHRHNQALISLAKVRKLKLPNITAIKADVAYVNASDSPVELQARRIVGGK